MTSKFMTKTGLSEYAFICGYIQRADLDDRRVDLFREGACWHVRSFNFNTGHRRWESFDSLVHSRLVFNRMCASEFKDELKWFRTDARYTAQREYCGEESPYWIARFCGDWIGKAQTPQQAKLMCFEHNAERMKWPTSS